VLPVTNRSCSSGWIDADDGVYGSVSEWVPVPFGSTGINATVFPDVTTRRFVCGDSSIDVIALGNVRLVVSFRVRKSHHLHIH
jgi:hypothetical protein